MMSTAIAFVENAPSIIDAARTIVQYYRTRSLNPTAVPYFQRVIANAGKLIRQDEVGYQEAEQAAIDICVYGWVELFDATYKLHYDEASKSVWGYCHEARNN